MLKIYYFTSQSCGPCKVFGPMLSEIVSALPGVELAKIDADDNPDIANNFKVRGFPTIVLHKENQEVGRHAGLIPKVKLQQIIENATKISS